MREADIDALSQRLANLERRQRWLKVTGTAALLALAAVAVMGQVAPTGRIVDAREFTVTDAAGRVRARLGLGDTGEVSLQLRDDGGKDRLVLALAEDRPSVTLKDKAGKSRALFYLWKDETPHLALWDENGKLRARVSADDKGPYIMFTDKEGQTRSALYVWKDDTPALYLKDKDGKHRLFMHLDARGDPNLALRDRDGRDRLSLAVEGEPKLTLRDESKRARATLYTTHAGNPQLVFRGDNDSPRVWLYVESRGSGMSVRDVSGKIRGLFYALSDGADNGPNLKLNDKNGNGRVWLGLSDTHGWAGYQVLNEAGNTVWRAP